MFEETLANLRLVITAPLQELLKKSVHFRWDDEQEDAFVKLKEALCKAPVLAYPDPDLPYVVDTDSSNLAIGAILSQVQDSEEKVIMYGSKAFSGSQRRWCMIRRELFAIIHFVIVKFSYYLLNQEFTLRTDHSSLRWLDSFHDKATDMLARWLHYLEPFRPYMTILYSPGKLHGDEEKRIAQKQDPELCRFMELLHRHTVKPKSKLLTAEPPYVKSLCTLWHEFRVQDEILYCTGKEVDDEWRLAIPRGKHTEILSL